LPRALGPGSDRPKKLAPELRKQKLAANLAGAKALYLNHFSGRYEDVRVLVDEAREIFPNTRASEDLMVVHVNYDGTVTSKQLQDVRARDDADDRPLS